MALISIIVPVYNVEKYLEKCVESLTSQTLKDIEIILINDGSQDLSGNICDSLSKNDSRIKVIHKENGGLSDARNIGIDLAVGEYLAFVDSDDWCEPKMFEMLYNLAIKYKADIVQGDYIEAYDEECTIDNIQEEISKYSANEILEELYGSKYPKAVVVWNKIYKKKLFDKIRFPKGKLHEDEFTTYKLFHKANLIIDTNFPLYYYRQRPGSIMNSEFNIRRLDKLEALNKRYEYFIENGLDDLANKTQANLCGIMKDSYFFINDSKIRNKILILKKLKSEMRENYFNFIKNKEITLKGKITLTLCILNGKLFCNIYRYKV